MLEELKKQVYDANMQLPKHNLVVFTWGNVSGIDREKGLFVIKPSGVPYESLKLEDMIVVDLNGNKVEGDLNPSSDTATHAALYREFKDIGGVVHTHSRWATIWSQTGRDIPPYGTTHADYIYGPVPCTRALKDSEVDGDYELETGNVIIERFKNDNINPTYVPAVLVKSHGPFTWGKNAADAVYNAVVLEEVAMMAWHTEMLVKEQTHPDMPESLKNKHFMRKHGPNAYYGQGKEH